MSALSAVRSFLASPRVPVCAPRHASLLIAPQASVRTSDQGSARVFAQLFAQRAVKSFLPFCSGLTLAAMALPAPARAAQDAAASTARALPPYSPHVEPASDEPDRTRKGFHLPPGFVVDTYAAEPQLAHPVCFTITSRGECYVAETFRHYAGVTDIREHMDWLDDDLAARSVADRVALYRKHLGAEFGTYETEHERVKLLRDTDGDGRIDRDVVFADGFHDAADGIGAGLLELDGDVWYACIPNLWRLRDRDGDGRADEREALSTGWGIRVALLGHDMHGLVQGPDGRVWWSIGDRGFRVTTREGDVLDSPFTGAVLRCEPDGSKLEVFATGLRNPQELAFDDSGELWTGDNNSDGGDAARLVRVLEASETGWRQAYQWLGDPHLRGPWNDERLWKPHFGGQAAYVSPPIMNVANGPSGLAIHPGTGTSERWNGHFFLCDFTGASEWSGVLSFTVKPRGATYEASAPEHFVWGPLATDCAFGVDGGLYVSDWVAGWNKTGKGRIWRVHEPEVDASEIVKSTRAWLAAGPHGRSDADLVTALAHPDRRVRQAAHLELATRAGAIEALTKLARDASAPRLARVHATWALGVRARRAQDVPHATFVGLLSDADEELRVQAARVLGDVRARRELEPLVRATKDASARVELAAAVALARLDREDAFPALVDLVERAGEADPALRHAATYGMWSCATPQLVSSLVDHRSVDVRVAACVALRRMQHPLIARFLDDADARVRAEAARAILDVPIREALDHLAVQITREGFERFDVRVPVDAAKNAFAAGNGWVRRVLHANFRAGDVTNATWLAQYAAAAGGATEHRVEALELLASWATPPPRDPFTGEWSPQRARPPEVARALVPGIGAALGLQPGVAPGSSPVTVPTDVVRAWLRLCARTEARDVGPTVLALARDAARDAGVRAEAFAALAVLHPEGTLPALEGAVFDADTRVRAAAITTFRELAPDRALPLLESARERSIEERRAAYQGLARLPQARVDELLERDLAALDAGRLPPAIALDLVQACEARTGDAWKARLAARTAARGPESGGDAKTAPYLDALHGGDAARGREIFRAKSQLECLRCHTAEGQGGLVGPNLTGVGSRLARAAILASIVDPNRTFASGYQGTIVFTKDETSVEGVVIEDVADHVKLRKADGTEVSVPRAEIDVVKPGLSAMPANLAEHLSREEMRDLIEYLTTL